MIQITGKLRRSGRFRADTPGRCKELDYCSIGQMRTLVRIPLGQAFVCPECGKPLRPPVLRDRGRVWRLWASVALAAVVVCGVFWAGVVLRWSGWMGGGAPQTMVASEAGQDGAPRPQPPLVLPPPPPPDANAPSTAGPSPPANAVGPVSGGSAPVSPPPAPPVAPHVAGPKLALLGRPRLLHLVPGTTVQLKCRVDVRGRLSSCDVLTAPPSASSETAATAPASAATRPPAPAVKPQPGPKPEAAPATPAPAPPAVAPQQAPPVADQPQDEAEAPMGAAPRIVEGGRPEYPGSVGDRQHGEVAIECTILDSGEPSDCKVEALEGGRRFAEAAVDWLNTGRVRFAPMVRDGHPVLSQQQWRMAIEAPDAWSGEGSEEGKPTEQGSPGASAGDGPP